MQKIYRINHYQTSKSIIMKSTFFITISLLLTCLFTISESIYALPSSSMIQLSRSSSTGQKFPGPVDELISLLEKYGDAIRLAESKESCDSLENELSQNIASNRRFLGCDCICWNCKSLIPLLR